jgi:hypothetical protein
MFAQISDPLPADPPPMPEFEPQLFQHPVFWLFQGAFSVVYLAYMALYVWMLIECIRKDQDRYFWLWIILIVPFGAVVYFFIRWMPGNQLKMPKAFRRFTGGRELARLEFAAMQIGNPHQHVQLGDALREAGQTERAGQAYREALQKEPKNTQALWGAALVEMDRKNFAPAAELLQTLLVIDPQYKFGDVSLAYGKALYEMGQTDQALEHLEKHVRRWRHPEALYLVAALHADRGNVPAARTQLQGLLLDINSSPKSIARKQSAWKSRAHKLLSKLPRG